MDNLMNLLNGFGDVLTPLNLLLALLGVTVGTAVGVLPGIGPALAARIIAWRDENGPFTSVDELDEVSGIGPSVLEQVRDLVRP